MKTITVDESAHRILQWAKGKCKEEGIENPSHSDAIRWIERKVKKKQGTR